MMPTEDRDRTTSSPEEVRGALYLRELTTDALRYWEPRRLIYNLLLALVVLGHFAAAWPSSRSAVTVDGVLGLFILAVLANVAFSVVYVADVFIQSSGFRSSRHLWRWAFLLIGFVFAAVLTHVMSGNMFVPPKVG